jgi:hypothetical protein
MSVDTPFAEHNPNFQEMLHLLEGIPNGEILQAMLDFQAAVSLQAHEDSSNDDDDDSSLVSENDSVE